MSFRDLIRYCSYLCISIPLLHGQHTIKSYQIRTIAFYNVENLFDTIDDVATRDDRRTPLGKDRWTSVRYAHKIDNLAYVISQIGILNRKSAPDLLGLCEVENRAVLQDLVEHPKLAPFNYGIVHMNSPDERGIDVALLYKKHLFIPSDFKSHRLLLFNEDGYRDYTRDQLVVSGFLDGEVFSILINHWPSRSGGEERSNSLRVLAAQRNKHIIDSLLRVDPKTKVITMGDLNDNPIDHSLKKTLGSVRLPKMADSIRLYNPMERLYRKGVGSLAYRDQWHLFDQILLNHQLLQSQYENYTFWKAQVFAPAFLITQKGRYKGYPFRTYSGGAYTGGYSDHFPVYIYVLREVL